MSSETAQRSVGDEEYKETWLRLDELKKGDHDLREDVEIEELIIRELVRRHEAWLDAAS